MQEHPLDNPIWTALTTGNQHLSFGTAVAKYIKRDVGFFAAMQTNSAEGLEQIRTMLTTPGGIILFTPGAIAIPACWKVKVYRAIYQMTGETTKVVANDDSRVQPMTDEHIPAMLALTKLTQPGPFLQRTIDYGNYEGIHLDEQLAAMAGQRLRAENYTEVSAICTHPNHSGKGYGGLLLQRQVNAILAAGAIPFLHVYPENPAVRLYEKTGFRIRKEMAVYFLEPSG